jgi:hypothetical protein
MVSFRLCRGLSESPPDARVAPDTSCFQPCADALDSCLQLGLKLRRRFSVHSTCAAPVHLLPGLREERWCQQVRANEVKRSVRSALSLAAICSSCVDIRFLLLSVGDVSLVQPLDLLRRFPLCAAFPRAEYYQRIRLPRQRRPSSGWSIQSAYSITCRSRPSWISQVP